MSAATVEDPRCLFCDRLASEIGNLGRLVVRHDNGRWATICDTCVRVCMAMITDDLASAERQTDTTTTTEPAIKKKSSRPKRRSSRKGSHR